MARLESTNQLEQTDQVASIFSLARELAGLDLSLYEGNYRNAELQFTLRFSGKDKILLVQVSGQEEVALQAVGRHTFLYPPSSAAFEFDLVAKRVILRQGGDTKEFQKE